MEKLKFNFQMEQITFLFPIVKEFILTSTNKICFSSGQYMSIKFTHKNKLLSQAHSVVSYDENDQKTFYTKVLDGEQFFPIVNIFETSKKIEISKFKFEPSCSELEVNII